MLCANQLQARLPINDQNHDFAIGVAPIMALALALVLLVEDGWRHQCRFHCLQTLSAILLNI